MQIDVNRVRKERENRGWSQEQLAKVTGLGLRTIQRIESSGTASLESATALASVYELSMEVIKPKTGGRKTARMIAAGVSSIMFALVGLFYTSAFADEALRLDYVYEKTAPDDESRSESQFLLYFDETATSDLKGNSQVVFRGVDRGSSVELEVTVYEYVGAKKTELVGTGKTTATFGEPANFTWKTSVGPDYSLTVTPTRATIEK